MNLTTISIHKTYEGSWGRNWKRLEALFRNYFYIPCDWRLSDYPIRRRSLEAGAIATLFRPRFLPSLQAEQCYKLRGQKILVIGIRRWFPLPSLRFPKIEEICWATSRIQGGKDISIPIPFLSSKLALTKAQDISCVRYFRKSQSDKSDRTSYNSRPSTLESLHIASNFGSLNGPDMIQVAQFLDLIYPPWKPTVHHMRFQAGHKFMKSFRLRRPKVAMTPTSTGSLDRKSVV